MIAILDNIRSMNNAGSIFRTADALGLEKIYLAGITPEPLDIFGRPRPQFAKVSLGAEKTVAWEKVGNTRRLVDKLKKDGYEIWAVEQAENSVPYNKSKGIRYKLKVAIVFGNEVRGIRPAVLKKCDKILEIPMRGSMVRQARHPRNVRRGKESLNVAVSFGIVMFHLFYGNKGN